jgi:fucose permease
LSSYGDSTFFSLAGEDYWTDSTEIHHRISRVYFAFGWLPAMLCVIAACVLVTTRRRSNVLSVLALCSAALFLTTATTQALGGAIVPVYLLGTLGAVLVAGAVFRPRLLSSEGA